jgi:prefoldin subunit 5
MPIKQINEAINLLESEIQELRALMEEWNRLSVNLNGAKQYKGVAKRIVL